jgi:hypothetical protein
MAELAAGGAETILWVSDRLEADVLAAARRFPPGVRVVRLEVGGGRTSLPSQRRAPRAARAARRLARSALGTARLLTRPPAAPPVTSGIVLVEHFERGARVAAAVAEQLVLRGQAPVFLSTSPEASAQAAKALVPLTPERAASRRGRLAALYHARRGGALALATAEGLERGGLASLGAHSGLVGEAVRGLGPVWSNGLRAAALWPDVVKRIGPSVMAATTNAPTPVRAAMAAGRAQGATTCLVQHGVLALHNYRTYLTHDWYLVWGQRDKRELVAGGAPPQRVVVTGSPVFGAVAERMGSDAGPSPDGAFRVVYLASRTGGRLVSLAQARSMLEMVREAVAWVTGCELTVKPHPGDSSGLFDSLDGVRVVRGGDAVDAILAADAAVVSTSTAGLEACALDRPVVALDVPGCEPLPHYDEYGAALTVRSAAELSDALSALSEGGQVAERLRAGRRRLVKDMFAGLEPGAAARVADHLLSLASGDSHHR